MADDFVQVAPDSTGKKIDNTTVTTGAGSVERQRVSIADAATTNNAAVTAAGALKVDPSGVVSHVVVDTAPSTAVTSAGLTNLDVALSTRTKPADQQHVIIDTIPSTVVTNANLDVALSTRLKPADTLAGVTTVAAVTAITNALPAGANKIGTMDIATAAATAKGTQGANAVPVQELKDAGRNQTNYFHAAPVITTTAEVMQTLTGYKGGIAVGATATPAVVTAGKTYRITRVIITYWAATVIGGALIRLRANLSGVGVVGSPLVVAWQVGIPAVFTAGSAATYPFDYPEGMEFPAGTGLAVGVIGEGADGVTGTITGKVMIAIEGYEY